MNPDLLLHQANQLQIQVAATTGNVHRTVCEVLNRLRLDVLSTVPENERSWYEARIEELDLEGDAPYPVRAVEARLVSSQIVSVLRSLRGGSIRPNEPITRVMPEGRRVFIVHGHDGESALRLRDLLRERWGLDPVILADEPQKGRSLIEKFEDEAGSCAFALVLLTPDDFVRKSDAGYLQARPNVLFELGWFYGRLGRSRVALIYRRGTAIPSDLAGVARVEFATKVQECALELETELRSAGLVPS